MSEPLKVRMSDDDLTMLGAFVKSPVFGAFKRLIDQHRDQCQGVLLSVDDHNHMLRLQGRIQGLNTLETLPALIVTQREAKDKKTAEAENVEDKVLKKHLEDKEMYARRMEEKRAANTEMLR